MDYVSLFVQMISRHSNDNQAKLSNEMSPNFVVFAKMMPEDVSTVTGKKNSFLLLVTDKCEGLFHFI
jgi:hypothetical protein